MLTQGENPAVCRYLIEEQDHSFSICTGSLIATDLVLSAAHCTEDGGRPISIQCGQLPVIENSLSFNLSASGNRVATGGVRFAETFKVKGSFRHPDLDMIIFKLDRPSRIRPFRVLPFVAENLKSCEVSGFGINNKIYAGIQWSAKLRALPIRITDAPKMNESKWQSASYLVTTALFPTTVTNDYQGSSAGFRLFLEKENLIAGNDASTAHGDSGSGLICETRDGKKGIFGVSSWVEIGSATMKGYGSPPNTLLFNVLRGGFTPADISWLNSLQGQLKP